VGWSRSCAPRQRFWGGQRTKGGWMRAPELAPGQQTLAQALIKAGLPPRRR
jgi:hypothetical protein